jgi:beta-lactamase class A
MSWTRRAALAGVASSVGAPAFGQLGPGAEFGWATSDTAGHIGPSMNADRRFPMCSSFKWLLAACVLARVDTGSEHLNRVVAFTPADIQDYAPTAKAALARSGGVRGEMTVEALCEAAVSLSDNTAANLLLAGLGGPAALTAWLRAVGDPITRLDRIEPALNVVPVGDARDTTTPAAMVGDLRRILFGDVLAPASRARLMGWMLDCKTGETRLKAGLPAGWRIAQKTGTWPYDPKLDTPQRAASGDVGVLLPPTGPPILIAAYTAGSTRPQAEVDAWFASVARTVAARDATLRTR